MAGDERPGGLTTGAMFVHVFVLKSYAHVSLDQKPRNPPKRITRSACESYASAWKYRAAGVGFTRSVPTGARGIGAVCQSLGREAVGSPGDASHVQILSDASLATPIAT